MGNEYLTISNLHLSMKMLNLFLTNSRALDLSDGERQRLWQEIGQLGGGGAMAPFSTRRGGIEDDDDSSQTQA